MSTFVKSILIIFTLFLGHTLSGQDYFIHSLKEAKKIAKEQNKFIFIDFSAVWCTPCQRMKEDIFPDGEVKKVLTQDFVCVELLHGKDKQELRNFKVNKFPTFLVLDSHGNVFKKWSGASPNKAYFLAALKMATPSYSLEKEKLDSMYQSQKKDLPFLISYYHVLKNDKFHKRANEIAERVLKRSKNWYEPDVSRIVLEQIWRKKSKKFVLKNKPHFKQLVGLDSLNTFLFLNYLGTNLSKDYRADAVIEIPRIKDEFIDLFGEDEYSIYFKRYLLRILPNKPEYKDTYEAIWADILNSKLKIFSSNKDSGKILELVTKCQDPVKLNLLHTGFKHQFKRNKDVLLEYYDIKAYLEYKLLLKDEAVKTIQAANSYSVREFHKPFRSQIHTLLKLEQMFHTPKD